MAEQNLQPDSEGELWEVFVQSETGAPHEHAGSVHATDAEMALQNARDVYARRGNVISFGSFLPVPLQRQLRRMRVHSSTPPMTKSTAILNFIQFPKRSKASDEHRLPNTEHTGTIFPEARR